MSMDIARNDSTEPYIIKTVLEASAVAHIYNLSAQEAESGDCFQGCVLGGKQKDFQGLVM